MKPVAFVWISSVWVFDPGATPVPKENPTVSALSRSTVVGSVPNVEPVPVA